MQGCRTALDGGDDDDERDDAHFRQNWVCMSMCVCVFLGSKNDDVCF